jgi:protein-S-isoprenylcysteine O-methyltransferase Ste14
MNDTATPAFQRPTSIPWPPILLAITGIGGWALGRYCPLPWPGVDDLPARVIGIGLGVLGTILLLWALDAFRRHRTTMLPHKGASSLITDGPYRRFRNPIYLGEALIFFGIAEATKNVWFVIAAFVFAILVTRLAIVPEERHLEEKFGDAYRNYKARTRRWI